MRILVIEDEADLLAGMARALREEGYAVDTAADGEEGLYKATNWEYDAIHYNRPGGHVRVTVAAADGWAVLTVADTGQGIAPEHLPHLFERFYRADQARSGAAGHAGLGLAIVQAIVEAHGGNVTVASEPDRGSTFTVRLPPG